jgi:hypothetical protein
MRFVFRLFAWLSLAASAAQAQASNASNEDQAVGRSISYVFATDLGSGIYDLDGRTLQIYQFWYRKDLREATSDRLGVRFELPLTFGFFDFKPIDVLSHGIPTRVDSFSVVPGLALDYIVGDDWHVMPYARAGFSVASSSVDGWLFGAGLRVERSTDFHGWDSFVRTDITYAGANYRADIPSDSFARIRQGFDLRRGIGGKIHEREIELGIYSIFDVVLDSPVEPLSQDDGSVIQAEFGFTFSTRPRFKIWRWDAPRLGFGYRLAGELTAWRFVIGQPF